MTPSFATAGFADRMQVLKQLANVTGIRLPQTIIPEGESLIPYGEDRKRALREEIYSLPTPEQASAIISGIRAEQQPVDIEVPIQRVRMNAVNGGLYGLGAEDRKPLGYTPVAFGHVCSEVKPDSVTGGFSQTLAALPPRIRADAFNHFASGFATEREVVLRTLKMPQKDAENALVLRRTLNAVVTKKYTAVEDDSLMDDIRLALPSGARVRYTQDFSRSDLEIFWPAMSRELKVGDIANICLQVTNSQTKQSSIRVEPKLLRVLCLNFTTAWSEGGETEISVRHVGDARAKFREAIRGALAIVEPFILAFGDAYQQALPADYPTRGEVISRTMQRFELPAKFGGEIAAAWDMDGTRSAGDTLAGLANAMTRASQSQNMERASSIEGVAGRLIKNGWAELD